MKGNFFLVGWLIALANLGTLLRGQEVPAGAESADWWKAQREVSAMLHVQGADLASIAAKTAVSRPQTAQEAMRKLAVLLRAGMQAEAIKAIGELKTLAPNLANSQISDIYYSACDHFREWEVARTVVERFADNISDVFSDNRLLKHFEESGWSVERIDQWLAGMPAGRENFWVKQRLRFNASKGRAETLVRELSDQVRKQPGDISRAVALLDALISASHSTDLAWTSSVLKPELASEAEQLASRLQRLGAIEAAAAFYQKAIDTPLSEKERQQSSARCAILVPKETARAMFAAHVREGLAGCLLKLGRAKESQKWMVEAADIREKHHLGRNALLAGHVQAASGQRVIEGRIRQEEKSSAESPEYWRERANYYRGRGESAQEEEALKKGFALAKPAPDIPSHGRADWRSWFLSDYAAFLQRTNRTPEAVAFLRKEIEQAPATSSSAKSAARWLAFELPQHVRTDDEVLWNWLAQRPTWEHVEQRLIWRMLENTAPGDRESHIARAERMAQGSDSSRGACLGSVLNRMRYAQRSIPLLEQAAARAKDDESKRDATFTLFESYLDVGDWKRAEGVFPVASKQLTPQELPDWQTRIAVVAAKAGARADALRIWTTVANLDAAGMHGLEELSKAGLRNDLIDFYRQLQQKLPSSDVPAKALKRLEGKRRANSASQPIGL